MRIVRELINQKLAGQERVARDKLGITKWERQLPLCVSPSNLPRQFKQPA